MCYAVCSLSTHRSCFKNSLTRALKALFQSATSGNDSGAAAMLVRDMVKGLESQAPETMETQRQALLAATKELFLARKELLADAENPDRQRALAYAMKELKKAAVDLYELLYPDDGAGSLEPPKTLMPERPRSGQHSPVSASALLAAHAQQLELPEQRTALLDEADQLLADLSASVGKYAPAELLASSSSSSVTPLIKIIPSGPPPPASDRDWTAMPPTNCHDERLLDLWTRKVPVEVSLPPSRVRFACIISYVKHSPTS